jgi:hypothetical protein
MRALKVAIFALAVVFAAGAPLALAQSVSNDVTLCCAEFNNLSPSYNSTSFAGGNLQVLGCRAINGQSVNACKANNDIVVGCAQTAFLCQPSVEFPGLGDCLCGSRGLLVNF